ncbi:MAG: DNA mismatch repair protein [Bacteroidota bacterium]|nr:DNA mismatch repair protein [Bacteroidota bacterium]
MSFVTDKQTQSDLNMLGKYKVGSIFNLFNRAKTKGGEVLLENMFRTPLISAEAINKRCARIKYLQDLEVELDINRELTEMASHYLTELSPATPLFSVFSCYKEKVQEMVYRSERLQIHQRHIYAVQEVLSSASNLLGQLQKKSKFDNPIKDMQDKMDKIIKAPILIQLKAKYPYTVRQTAQCHYLFLNKFKQAIQELLHLLYEFDVYISVANVAMSKRLIYAVADDNDKNSLIDVENLRHPALKDAVGNTINIRKKDNVVFLTGANMAGKSTWMKTLGISFYLAHMGFPVAADKMRFTAMEGIYTSINVPDDISLGWSHFYAEVMRVKLVAKEISSGKRLFVLFDELFKGTNVKDAYDATLIVTQKLAKYRTCAFVISTHIIEVGEELMGTPNIQFHYMPTVMKGTSPHYTYNMTSGITTDRQGMIIIENEKILEMLASPPS